MITKKPMSKFRPVYDLLKLLQSEDSRPPLPQLSIMQSAQSQGTLIGCCTAVTQTKPLPLSIANKPSQIMVNSYPQLQPGIVLSRGFKWRNNKVIISIGLFYCRYT